MAAPSYVGQGAAQAVTTSAAMPYPTGLAAGDLLILHVASSVTGIQNAPAGWTELGTLTTAGSMSSRRWIRISDGTETGSVTVNVTSGTKGVGYITAYRPANAGGVLSATMTSGADTTSNNTSYSATGSSWTIAVDERIVCETVILTTGTFSGNATSPTIAQTGATLSNTARFAGRTGTNTIYYGHHDASVTAGSTNTPAFTATTAGANGTGHTVFILVHEAPAPITGSAAITLPALTASGSGTVSLTGSGAVTLPALGASGAGDVRITGAASVALPALTAAATGDVQVTGSGALSLPALAASGTGVLKVDGAAAAVLPGLVASGSGVVEVEGSGALQLPALVAAGTGTVSDPPGGTGTLVLPALVAAGTGTVSTAGAAQLTLPALTATAVADVRVSGVAQLALPALVAAGTGTVTVVQEPRDLDGTFHVAGDRASVRLLPDRASVTIVARDRAQFVVEED